MIAAPSGEPLETLAPEDAAPPPVFEEIRTAQPGRATAAKAMMESIARTELRLARTRALG
jgi:hypothetical protein